MNNALTKRSLLDLFRRQGKRRNYLNHYFDDDIRHYLGRTDRRINLQMREKFL